MRERPSRAAWSLTKTLTVALVVIYGLQCVNDVYLQSPVELWLALTPACFRYGFVWQLITFQFLHATLLHIACNLLVFWWAGHFVESVLGKSRFLIALFGCGVVGGILQGLLMVFFPFHFGMPVVGASAGVSGLFAIFAMLERDSEIRLYFVLPVRAMTLLWASGIVSLFFTLVPTPREMGVAHAAHLGGILAGVAWVKLGWHRDYVRLPWEGIFIRWRQRRARSNAQRTPVLASAGSNKKSRWPRVGSDNLADLPSGEFISRQVDPILDKISAQGIQSLTDRERRILEAARAKMSKH